MSLVTGERLNRRSWTELPMDDVVIARVEAMALAQNQPLLKKTGPLFEWRPGLPFIDTPIAQDDEPILMDVANDHIRAPDPLEPF